MSFRELALILVVVAAGAGLIYLETRDRAVLSAAAVMLVVFALGGALAVVAA